MSNITHRQHYVPQFYMRNFSSNPAAKKERQGISFCDLNKNIANDNIPIKSICYEMDFYDSESNIENFFKALEGQWSNTIKELIYRKKISPKDLANIKSFIVYQNNKTLAMLNHVKKIEDQLLYSILKYDCINNINNFNITPKMLIEYCDELIYDVKDLSGCCIINHSDVSFITSDMPVVTINPFNNQSYGMINAGIIMLIPLSKEIIVAIYDKKIYSKTPDTIDIFDVKYIHQLNKYQFLNAESYILSDKKSNLELYINDNELVNMRKKIKETNIINQATDNNSGKLHHIKARGLPYNFKLPFFKMPKYIENIPQTCKYGLNRKYDIQQRISLIMMRDNSFDEIKKNCSRKDIENIKDGYRKTIAFMDKYWRINKKDVIASNKAVKKTKMNYLKSI